MRDTSRSIRFMYIGNKKLRLFECGWNTPFHVATYILPQWMELNFVRLEDLIGTV